MHPVGSPAGLGFHVNFGGFKLPVPIGGIKLTMQMYWEFWRKMP